MPCLTIHCLPLSIQPNWVENKGNTIGNKEVHIWLCQWRTISDNELQNHYQCLTVAEQKRANAFHFADDRQRYILSQGMLRTLLGQYLLQNPTEITFLRNERDKPFIANSNLQFSVAHSGDNVAVAIAHTPIGIDIEQQQIAHIDWQLISQTYFSASEQILLAQDPQPQSLFALLWTRKEAILKATGAGLNEDMRYLETTNGTHIIDAPFASAQHQHDQTLHVASFEVDTYYISLANATEQTLCWAKYEDFLCQK